MGGQNIGNLLNSAGVTWGWFEGGFNLSITNPNGTTGCARNTTSPITGSSHADYSPHHEPFQYYSSTANPSHLPPSSAAAIGTTDQANHQYDVFEFFYGLKNGVMPAVSFLKAPAIQDAHAGYSSPLDEQEFVVQAINATQRSPFWANTAVIIAYDDSDGWYDHQLGPIVNQSNTTADALSATGACGNGTTALPGVNPATLHAQGRCGYGPRLPLQVISIYAKKNFVDHTVTDQSSIIRFVEDNWLAGQRLGAGSTDALAGTLNNMFNFNQNPPVTTLILNPSTGLPVKS